MRKAITKRKKKPVNRKRSVAVPKRAKATQERVIIRRIKVSRRAKRERPVIIRIKLTKEAKPPSLKSYGGPKKHLTNISRKLLVLALIISLNSVAISRVGYTLGYYNDIESSTENTLEAGSVDFSLAISGWQATTTAVSMPPGDIVKKTVEINPQDSNPFQYFATSTNFVGDSDFCTGLNVVATLEGVEIYNGPLTGLRTATTTTLDSWEFTYTTGVNNFQNKICDFDIDYNGWQTRHNYPTYENGGFSDTEKVKNRLASWGFRINKVYYDVAPSRGIESPNGLNEWVEIYNQTNTALDITGWQICDNTSCDTLPLTPLIPALKYAVIVATSTTVSSLLPAYWYLPSEVTLINIGQEIGNGLANGGDRLILKRPDGVVIDEMNWQNDTGVWNPGAVNVAEGNVLARVPSGYDTDQASDWKELKPPSVDLIYPDEGGSYTWYWTYSYTILWDADNNNGPDGDLDISLFFVKDVNHDGIISTGDTTHTIAESTANDGVFDWTVPSGFLGYIWIYLVAIGPENPMLNSGTVSGRIYDPFPIFIGPKDVIAPESSPLPSDSGEATLDEEATAGEVEIATSTEAVIEEELIPEVEVPTEPVEPVIVPEAETPVVIEEKPVIVEDAPIEPAPAE